MFNKIIRGEEVIVEEEEQKKKKIEPNYSHVYLTFKN